MAQGENFLSGIAELRMGINLDHVLQLAAEVAETIKSKQASIRDIRYELHVLTDRRICPPHCFTNDCGQASAVVTRARNTSH
jgi:hypothetical protein